MKSKAATAQTQQAGSQNRELALKLFEFLDSKKARDIQLLNLEKINPYFQLFMIATATSSVHLKSMVKEIQKTFASEIPKGFGVIRPEEMGSGWVIIDFVDLVLHIFLEEQRHFYRLERLWGDAEMISLEHKNA